MLANHEFFAASAAARHAGLGAVLETDPRVQFACLVAGKASPDGTLSGSPCVAVYLDPAADAYAVRRELADALAKQASADRMDVAILNTMDMEEAGRLLRESELLLDRDRAARVDFESRVSGAYFDFRESERLFLRERAERPYAEVAARKLAALDVQIRRLREFEGMSLEEYVADWRTAYVVERALEVTTGLCIDVTRHTLAERGLGIPGTYRGIFAAARDAGLIEPGLAMVLAHMCGFRNVLAHEGDRIDAGVVVRILTTDVKDFVRFREAASRW